VPGSSSPALFFVFEIDVFMKSVLYIAFMLTMMAVRPADAQGLLTYTDPGATCDRNSDSSIDQDDGTNFYAIEALDTLTVKFTLCRPDPAFPSKVAFASFAIHPSEYLEATGGSGDLIQQPIGTGPYSLQRWDLGSELVLARNDNYWGEPAKEPTLVFRWNAEAAARLIELQSGNVDGIDNPGAGDFGVISNDPNLVLFERSGLNVFFLGMNNQIAPFDNLQVRQAIAHAIDKERIVEAYYPPGSTTATQFMPPALFGYTSEIDPLDYDPDLARQLLAESGVPMPIQTTLHYRDVVRGYLPQPGIVAVDIQAQLANVGINVDIVVEESGAFIDRTDAGEIGLYLLGWSADYPDPTNFLDFHFGAGASRLFGATWPEITAPLAEAAALADQTQRYDLYVEANAAIRDLTPMLPIAHGASATAFQSRIGGAHSSPLSAEIFSVMIDPDDDNVVWMQNAEPIGLYCADESDGETLRACEQINESLLAYQIAGTDVVPSLATSFSANETATEWTFPLRPGVTFHDGSTLDANDVVLSYVVQWDAAHPLHVGRDGSFTYFSGFFGGFLHPPESE
jgi:peptide/nickel transport system substrate-binding protein